MARSSAGAPRSCWSACPASCWRWSCASRCASRRAVTRRRAATPAPPPDAERGGRARCGASAASGTSRSAATLHAFVGYGSPPGTRPSWCARTACRPARSASGWRASASCSAGSAPTSAATSRTAWGRATRAGRSGCRASRPGRGALRGRLLPVGPTCATALLFAGIPVFFGAMYLGPTFSITQALAPLRMRAVASAFLLFLINLIGLGLGPQVVGIAQRRAGAAPRAGVAARRAGGDGERQPVVGRPLLPRRAQPARRPGRRRDALGAPRGRQRSDLSLACRSAEERAQGVTS